MWLPKVCRRRRWSIFRSKIETKTILLEQNDEWVAQRVRCMTLATIAASRAVMLLPDSLPWLSDQSGPGRRPSPSEPQLL
jgi:hypothetical protein